MPGAATQPPAGEFTVSIRTSEESWLSVTADGKPAFQRLFDPMNSRPLRPGLEVQMVIGNPGGTELSLNGKPLPLGGRFGPPTKDRYRCPLDWLRSSSSFPARARISTL